MEMTQEPFREIPNLSILFREAMRGIYANHGFLTFVMAIHTNCDFDFDKTTTVLEILTNIFEEKNKDCSADISRACELMHIQLVADMPSLASSDSVQGPVTSNGQE